MRWIIFFLLVMPVAFGSITIEKDVDREFNVGDSIDVLYKIRNDFNSPVTVTLTDSNLIGQGGFEIECIEFQLPPKNEGILDLKSNGIDTGLIASRSGEFTLDNATLTFLNPEINLIDQAHSEPVNITISGEGEIDTEINKLNLCSNDQKQSQEQKEKQMQSQPSREKAKKNAQQQQKKMEQQYHQQSDLQKKVEHAQQNMHQDTSALKDALEQERERQKQRDEMVRNQLENNQRFEQAKKSLNEQGFEQVSSDITAKDNNTGDFEYSFENPQTKETAKLSGKIEDSEVTELKNTNEIKKDEEYTDLKKRLDDMGFMEDGEPVINNDEFSTSFTNPKTGEKAKIRGDYKERPENIKGEFENSEMMEKINQKNPDFAKKINETQITFQQQPFENPEIVDINESVLSEPVEFNRTTGDLLEEPKYKKNYWKLLWLLPVVFALAYLLTSTKKYEREEKKIDYKEEALKMLQSSKKLFERKIYKEAYSLASYAVRYYISNTLDMKTEITSYEAINLLKSEGFKTDKAKDCLDLCMLVEFAKYKPNSKDFNKIIKYAEHFITGGFQDGR